MSREMEQREGRSVREGALGAPNNFQKLMVIAAYGPDMS